MSFVSTGEYGMEIDQYDLLSSQYTGDTGMLVINANSDPAFDPSQSYHILVMHANCPDAVMQVSVESITAPAPVDAGLDGGVTADASGDEPDNPGKGCDCRTSGSTDGALPPLLMLLAMLAIRRRALR